ncbi:MAG: hypothetical protein IPI46_12115 [Bacteroidetes bacterium]|nr:hypothetical protein [Bacteroidota bacterium]
MIFKKYIVGLLFLFALILNLSCVQKKKFDGDTITNYPDIHMIFRQYLAPYQKEPYTFKLTITENGKKDSTFLKAKEVDWKKFEKPFLQANLFQEKLDGHYVIDVLHDTLHGNMTMLLSSLDPQAITSKMSITATTLQNKILTLYAETHDAGFITSTEYKLLYVVGKTLQVQEISKTPFSGVKHTVSTLSFLN